MSQQFTATFGVHAGYGQHTGAPNIQEIWVSSCIHRAIEYVRDASGVVVGCVVTPARVFYPTEFGCPDEGEVVIAVTGAHNPKPNYILRATRCKINDLGSHFRAWR